MGWLDALERRSLENPSVSLNDPAAFDLLGAVPSSSGVPISPEGSLTISTVFAAVRAISSAVATLPLKTYRRTEQGKEVARSHPVARLLSFRPNPEMTAFQWRETSMAHLLLYGNSFAEIERNGAGIPVALWPLHPTLVTVERKGGRKAYVVRVEGKEVPVTPDNILHVAGFGLDATSGLIPTTLARDTLGHAKALETFGSSFFKRGASPSGVLSHPGKLGPDAAERLRQSWDKLYSGLSNSQRTVVLEEGMSYSPLGIAPEHAQWLESRRFAVVEVARYFGIPANLIGAMEHSTWNNIEHQSMQFVTGCVEPWAKRIEQVINHDLFSYDEHFAEHDLRALMRGDSASRAAYYQTMHGMGVYSINEIRELENLNRIPEGDARMVPLNMGQLGQEVEQSDE